jgi:hypothetical protein
MRRIVVRLVVVMVGVAPAAPALADTVDVLSPEHMAFIESLPAARAAVQVEHAQALEHGVVAEMHEANAAIVQFLGDSWLELAAVWPDEHFGTPSHADYLNTFTLSRIVFYRAINTFPGEPLEAPVLSMLIGNRLVKDLDQFVADTATAQLAQYDPVLSLEWLSEWQEAAR